jgi:OOP family OmpA-OmpF porin
MNPKEGPKKKSRAWCWGLLALLILVLACLWVNGQRIPQDITKRTTDAAGAWGVPAGLTIGVDGRDVVLTGEIDPMIDRGGLVKMVQSLRGVRSVTDSLTLAALEPARFRLQLSDRQAVLTGLLPSREAAEKLEAKAAGLVGEGKLTSRIETKPGVAAPAWVTALATLIPALRGAATAGIDTGPEGLILTGTVSSDAERQRIGKQAEALFAGVLAVDNRIVVLPPKRPAGLALRGDSESVALSGELSGEKEIERVRAAVRSAFPGAKITDTLTVGDSVAPPVWLEPVLGLMPELSPVAQAGLDAAADGITLSGTVPSPELRERIAKKAQTLLGAHTLVNRIEVAKQVPPVEVPPPAPPPAKLPAPPPAVEFHTLYFPHDSTELAAESQGALDAVVDRLRARPGRRLELAGFADASGEEAYNLGLSRRRAEAIRSYLVSKGIDPGRLVPRGYGEGHPAADNGTPEGRALNRRVELKTID